MTIDKLMQALARLEAPEAPVLIFDQQTANSENITSIEVTWEATGEVRAVVIY